ncbi:MAG: hypothetical protein AAF937_13185 [Planctomycetota bacterium]
MIAVIDAWGTLTPPAGAADDDDLFAATGVSGAIVVGDRFGAERARAMGMNVVQHIGVTTRLSLATRMQVRRKLPRSAPITPLSIWTAGVLGSPLGQLPEPRPLTDDRREDTTPLVVPVASNPADIDAFALTLSAGLLDAAGAACVIGLPSGAAHLRRARRLLSCSDRLIAVRRLGRPSPAYIASADVLLDLGVRRGGPIDRVIGTTDAHRIDGRTCATPLSLAIEIKRGLQTAASR